MGMTELDQVQALIDNVLPDPAGFAQRLMMQAAGRWGRSGGAGVPRSFTTATAEHVPSDAAPDGWAAAPVGTNVLLSAALGACECWGTRPDCELCQGHGHPGWTRPDPELFAEFVRPAILAMAAVTDE